MRKRCLGLLALLTLISSGVSAQVPAKSQSQSAGPITAERLRLDPIREGDGAFQPLRGSSRGARIHGRVQNHLGVLIPNAGVIVIRRLLDGHVAGQTTVDGRALFSVQGVEPGVFAAELVDAAGNVIATSGAFSAGIGEVVQLPPVVPFSQTSALTGLFSNATAKVISSAANAGILSVSPGAPVSP